MCWAAAALFSSSSSFTTTTTTVAALPFGRTRGGSGSSSDSSSSSSSVVVEQQQFHDANIQFVQVPAASASSEKDGTSSSSSSSLKRNAVVERYFDKNDDDCNNDDASQELHTEIHTQAAALHDFMVTTRRELHQIPELMYQEAQTSQTIQRILRDDLQLSYSTGWAVNAHPDSYDGPGGHGIVVDIGTGQAPCVLLRADMDALPIAEETAGIEGFQSKNPGRMHACGHDGHTTMLLGAAAVLSQMQDSLNGTVRLMFQPAEEGGAGAKRMIAQGVLQQEPPPQHAFGLHVWPTLPSGVVAGRAGPLLAACERFEITIAGVGGHAAMPHLTVDPVVTAAAVVMNLQTIVSRTVSPLEAGVCSVTMLQAGDAFNIIPSTVTMRGTIRALSTDTLLQLRDRVAHIVQTTAATHGANASITYSTDYYPPTVNDPTLYETFAKPVAAAVSAEGVVRDVEPTLGAEDFSFVAESIPSAFFLLGQGSGRNPPTNYGLHHPQFALDESVLSRGVELHVNLALRALQKLGSTSSSSSAKNDDASSKKKDPPHPHGQPPSHGGRGDAKIRVTRKQQ